MELNFNLPDGFRFEEASHSYWIHDKQIPGVTSTIAAASLYPFPPSSGEWPSAAMLRGSIVHQAIDDWYKGKLEDIDPEFEGYVFSERRFVEDSGFKMLASEVPLCHTSLFYGCTPDRIGILNEKLVLIDSKTGGECDAYHVQLTANFFAAISLKIPLEAAYLLELKSTGGRPRLIPNRDYGECWEVFLAALTCAKWRLNHVGNY